MKFRESYFDNYTHAHDLLQVIRRFYKTEYDKKQ